MDQTTNLSTYDRRRAADRLAAFIVPSIDGARAVEKPFFHLEFDRVFPDDIYAQILALMPESSDYRPMHAEPVDYDRETVEGRRARRLTSWTPSRIVQRAQAGVG